MPLGQNLANEQGNVGMAMFAVQSLKLARAPLRGFKVLQVKVSDSIVEIGGGVSVAVQANRLVGKTGSVLPVLLIRSKDGQTKVRRDVLWIAGLGLRIFLHCVFKTVLNRVDFSQQRPRGSVVGVKLHCFVEFFFRLLEHVLRPCLTTLL